MTETKDDIKQLETQAVSIRQLGDNLKIIDTPSYEKVCKDRKLIKGFERRVHEYSDGDISAAHKLHKSLIAKQCELLTPVKCVLPLIDGALRKYTNDQEQKRRAEEIRLQELARKQEEDRRLAEAVAIEQAGDKKLADQVIAAPVEVPPVIVAKSVPKVQGISYTERWTYRVINPAIVPAEFKMLDEVKIGQYARAMKSAGRIPGIEIYSERSVSGRG